MNLLSIQAIMYVVFCTATADQVEVPKPESSTGITLHVKTTSDQLDIHWYDREGGWADITNFTVIIQEELEESKFCASDVYCIDTQCSFSSKEHCSTGFDSCTRVIVALLGLEVIDDAPIELEYSQYAKMAPLAPTDVSYQLARTNIDISWTLPSTCELGTLLHIRMSDDIVTEYLLAPTDHYHYSYDNQTFDCDVGGVLLKTVGENGESYGTSFEFLLAEITTLNIEQVSDSEINVHWVWPSCAKKMHIAWYDGSQSSSNFIGEVETTSVSGFTTGLYTISGIQGYEQVLVCVMPLAKGYSNQWVSGEEVCLEAKAPTTTISTASPTITTSTTTAIESTTNSLGLSCYSCFDCPSTSASTAVTQDPAYTTCFISFVAMDDGSYVVRGGERAQREDGECDQTDTTLSCYCGHNLCNGSPVIV